MGGLMSITGLPGQGPVRVGIPIADLTAGIFLAQGILVALLERETSGEGQWVKTSLLEAEIFMLDFQASRWLLDKDVPKQAGNNHPTSIPTGVFKTSDGYINIAAAGQVIWERFCRAVDAPELIVDPAYAKGADRSKNRDALNEIIGRIVATRPSKEWVDRLNAAGVPAGPIYAMDEVFADPQVKHLGMTQPLDTKSRGRVEFVRQPMTLSRTPSAFRTAPPAMGEHTDEILREFGYTDGDIADLRKREIV
jgi:crotonobetainyl-CoA:carnitine CoA-transferase CaiB-like acyl-CoA transferase